MRRPTEWVALCYTSFPCARSSVGLEYLATNQGVVGSNPAGRAKFQRLGNENQVLLIAVGPLWNDLSTGPVRRAAIHALGAQNQVLLVAVGLPRSRCGDRPRRVTRSAFRFD